MNIEAKLGLDVFKIDQQPHIVVNDALCGETCVLRPCLVVCPANLYTLDDQQEIQVDFEGCLECGTCFIACADDALTWHYPRAGHGVQYRFG
jgi:ferredoxin like protein